MAPRSLVVEGQLSECVGRGHLSVGSDDVHTRDARFVGVLETVTVPIVEDLADDRARFERPVSDEADQNLGLVRCHGDRGHFEE